MNRTAYTLALHKHPRIGEAPLFLFLHSCVAHVTLPMKLLAKGDRSTVAHMTHIRREVLEAVSASTFTAFCKDIQRVEEFLESAEACPGPPPSDQEIHVALSFAFHLFAPEDKLGAKNREVITMTLDVLQLGAVLSMDALVATYG